ncbi:hypothetical protein BB560_006104, partial [Smittium megazygosporum]
MTSVSNSITQKVDLDLDVWGPGKLKTTDYRIKKDFLSTGQVRAISWNIER